MRKVRMVSLEGTRSWISWSGKAALGQMALSLMSVRPVMITVPPAIGTLGLTKRPC